MQLVYNPITGLFDLIGMTNAEKEAYLKLDQTTPQQVINGAPSFQEGLVIKSGKKIIFDGS